MLFRSGYGVNSKYIEDWLSTRRLGIEQASPTGQPRKGAELNNRSISDEAASSNRSVAVNSQAAENMNLALSSGQQGSSEEKRNDVPSFIRLEGLLT